MGTSASLYTRINRWRFVVTIAAAGALVTALLIDLSIGSSNMPIGEIVAALRTGPGSEAINAIVVWDIRLPMTLTCVVVGGSLGLAGLCVQTITGNSLASPYTLGITASASFGAAISITAGFSVAGRLWIGTSILAFLFALSVAVTIFVLGKLKGMSTSTLILAGIVMNFFFSALQQFLQYRASTEVAQIISSWTFGNLSRSTWVSAALNTVILILGFVALIRLSWKLTTLAAGEERALSLGVNVERLRFFVFVVSSLLISAAVAFIGTVAFVGLVVPHCSRLILGEDQRYLMPVSVLFGGVLMLLASVASKLMSATSMLPIGIVTSLIGVPFLFTLLMKKR